MNWPLVSGNKQGKNFSIIFLSILLIITVSLACNLPIGILWGGEQDSNNNQTQTAQARGDKSADNSGESDGLATTEPAEVPSFTPSLTPSLTPTMTLTPTPYVEISGNTNCRFGPGDVYDLIHTYLAGDQALLLGKDAGEYFWYIQNPVQTDLTCWLWGKYATPVGDTASLPVFTPPPTPTPSVDFSVAYEGSDCGAGSCWLWFSINNTGGVILESVKTYAKNTVTSAQKTYKSNLFQDALAGSDISQAGLGATVYTHSGQLPNPSGDKVQVTITACSKNDQGGICLSKSLSVTP